MFDLDAMADGEREPRSGLIDLVMDLFVAGIWVAVVSTRQRESAEALLRQLVGDGLVETLVTADDVTQPGDDVELYRLALWELGIRPEAALAFAGSGPGLRAAVAAKLPAQVRARYDGLLTRDCQRLHRRWWIAHKRAGACPETEARAVDGAESRP